MPNSRAWDLLQAMKARLQLIAIDDGYHTDAGQYVIDEPHQKKETEGAYYICPMFEAGRRSESPARRPGSARSATIAVIAMVAIERDHAQQTLLELLEDIDTVFKPTSAAMQPIASGVTFPKFVGSEVLPRAEGMKWVGGIVRFEADYLIP